MFTYAVLSEVGEREINEDSVGFAPVGKDIGMVILADGLGGHGRGEDASALVTTASKEVFRYYYNQKDCLERCFMESQKRLMKKQADENARQDLKTTLVLLRIVNGYVQWGHVGDSRLYYFKNGKIVSSPQAYYPSEMKLPIAVQTYMIDGDKDKFFKQLDDTWKEAHEE